MNTIDIDNNSYYTNIFLKRIISLSKFEKHKILFNKEKIQVKYNHFTNNGRITSNLSSLKHENRKFIKSNFGNDGIFFYFDFKSLHPNLILSLMKKEIFKFKNKSKVCLPIASFYDELGIYTEFKNKSKEEIKKNVFTILYGFQNLPDINILENMYNFSNNIYQQYLKDEFIKTPFGKIIKLDEQHQNRGTIFANFIQSIESNFLPERLYPILKENNNLEIIPILYLYDGMLFDVKKSEKNFKEIKNIYILLSNGKENENQYFENEKFPLSLQYGNNFGNMKTYI